MPHSLRVRLKNLQRKGELTEKDIDRIFKALEQEPCEDAISRQAVLDELSILKDSYMDADDLKEIIKELPSIRPQKQTGHWIEGKCDQCGGHAPFWGMASTYYESEYCPNCGARMESEE